MHAIDRSGRTAATGWISGGLACATLLGASTMALAISEPAEPRLQAPAAQPAKPPAPFLTFYSGGADSFLRSPKDAWLLSAVKRLEAEGVQLPPELQKELDSHPEGRLIAQLIRDVLTTRIAGAVAFAPSNGQSPPMPEGQISFMGNARRPGRTLEPTFVDGLRMAGLLGQFKPDTERAGLRTFAAQGQPPVWFGSLDMAGGSATVFSVGRPPISEAPDFTRLGVAKGVEPQLAFELDFAPLQPLLGMASAMLPPGADGRSPLEQAGLLSKTPMIMRFAATNDGSEGRVDARLVNGATAMKVDAATRAMVLTPADLQWLPADARTAWIGKGDLPAGINSAIDQYNAQAAIFGDEEDFVDDSDKEGAGNEGMIDAWVKEHLGLDLRRDIVAPLGNTTAYHSRTSLGGGILGSVVIIGLRDSATMIKTLDRLGSILDARPEVKQAGFALRARTASGCEALYSLSFAGVPVPFQLAIGIGNGGMVVGLTPQSVVAAIAQAKAKSSIMDHPGFKSMNAAEMIKGANSFGMLDAAWTARDGYGTLLALATALDSSLLPQSAPTTPVGITVPSLDELLRNAKPSVLVGRIEGDDLTWTYRCDSSFSLQTAALAGSIGGGGLVYTSMLAGMLVPALTQAREAAREVAMERNEAHAEEQEALRVTPGFAVGGGPALREIGMGLQLYAADNGDRLPQSLDELVQAGHLTGPLANARRTEGLTGEFGYRRPGTTLSKVPNPARTMVAWEEFDTFPRGGIFVLFLDAHVEKIGTEANFKALQAE